MDFMAPEMLGWCIFDPMGGARPIAWSEIRAFSSAAGLDLEPWEAQQLRAMSADYVSGLHLGSDPFVVSPAYEACPEKDPGIKYERQLINDTLKAGFSALKSAS
ncbi:hypothetical protein PGA1_c22340 [Phaeobacter inhibens DSM 17395]|nr:hypothetical protein PGA1_c22340 [Phaeobacter inhibens DSM 17395]